MSNARLTNVILSLVLLVGLSQLLRCVCPDARRSKSHSALGIRHPWRVRPNDRRRPRLRQLRQPGPGCTDDRPRGAGPLQRPSQRRDPGWADGLLLREGWRGAAALKTWWVVIAVGCILVTALAGCSWGLPGSTPARTPALAPAASVVKDPSIPGIGATRADWDASHTPNAAFNNGMVYGDNPGLPSYLAANGAVYIRVFDFGTGRIQNYWLNMHTLAREQALARVRQELPSDAKVAWDLTFNHCYRVAFASATLEAAGHYMAEVQLDELKADATTAMHPHTFNQAKFQLDPAGSPPNPELDCRHRIRVSTLDLRVGTLRPAG